jgi:hypothetical protein
MTHHRRGADTSQPAAVRQAAHPSTGVAPPRALSTQAPLTHVLTDFEDGIAEALDTRFTHQTPDVLPARRTLRASVLARASVAAIRSAMIARAARVATDPSHRFVDDFAAQVEEAFDVLRGAT